jgi:hypothetical protein
MSKSETTGMIAGIVQTSRAPRAKRPHPMPRRDDDVLIGLRDEQIEAASQTFAWYKRGYPESAVTFADFLRISILGQRADGLLSIVRDGLAANKGVAGAGF